MLELAAIEMARSAAAPLGERLGLAARIEPFARHRFAEPLAGAPTLHLDDVSDIPFLVDISGVEQYQHRARLRAGDGDLFAAVTPVTDGYEDYCRDRLGLGEVSFLFAPPVDGALAVAQACCSERPRTEIVAAARRSGGLVIHPYMGIEAVWRLAATVADEAGVPVRVLGPPPPVTWIANDKALFEDLVAAVLGREWLVESVRSREPRVLAGALLALGETYPRVALKRLRCASAMGNLVFEAAALRRKGRGGVTEEVERFLRRTQWRGDEEVLAVGWEETELSPSTQLWIPPLENGPPRLDGIYEQILEGEARVFVGSRPSRLPESVHARLALAALEVAAGLQSLGYVGRCSFDHLVLGDPHGECELRFTECNGRWGGTSTPMSLVDRLRADGRPPYRAQDFVHPGLVGIRFAEVLERVGEEAYRADNGRGRYLFYNVGPLERFGKLDVVALGETQEEAEAAMLEELPRRLGLG